MVSTALGGALLLCLLAPKAHAEVVADAEVSVEDSVEPDGPKEDKWKEPWRGSSFSYRNSVTAISLNKDADPGYDPNYMMSWSFDPRWWIGNVFNVSMGLSLSRELTDSNWTTEEGETIVSDFTVGLGASNFVTVPVLGIDVSAKLGVVAPTSKISRARTMILALKPGFSLSKNFDVLSGINLGYSFTYTKNFHEYTTAQTEEALIDAPAGATGRSYESYYNTGVRNASWGLTNMFFAGVSFVDWLSFGANFGLVHSFVYDQEDAVGEQMSEWDGYGTDDRARYVMIYGLNLTATPNPALDITIGADTANSQLSPDSTYETPFFNRYTAIYLDLSLDIAGLTSQLTSSED